MNSGPVHLATPYVGSEDEIAPIAHANGPGRILEYLNGTEASAVEDACAFLERHFGERRVAPSIAPPDANLGQRILPAKKLEPSPGHSQK